MLVKLLPEQIDKYWKVIKYAIQHTLPAGEKRSQEKLNNALEELLLDKRMQAWLCVREKNTPIDFEPGGLGTPDMDYDIIACVITTMVVEVGTKVNMLRILCIFAFEDIPRAEWLDGLEALRKFAKVSDCAAIDAFTDNDSLVSYAKTLGGDTKTYIQLSLEG